MKKINTIPPKRTATNRISFAALVTSARAAAKLDQLTTLQNKWRYPVTAKQDCSLGTGTGRKCSRTSSFSLLRSLSEYRRKQGSAFRIELGQKKHSTHFRGHWFHINLVMAPTLNKLWWRQGVPVHQRATHTYQGNTLGWADKATKKRQWRSTKKTPSHTKFLLHGWVCISPTQKCFVPLDRIDLSSLAEPSFPPGSLHTVVLSTERGQHNTQGRKKTHMSYRNGNTDQALCNEKRQPTRIKQGGRRRIPFLLQVAQRGHSSGSGRW